MEKLSYIKWNEITHIIQQDEETLFYYSDSHRDSFELGDHSFNSLLLYNESFVKVNYNTIVNKEFISSVLKIRRKTVLLINNTEIKVSRRKSYYFQ